MRYARQNRIIELINTYEIDTQETLANLLRADGFEATQATISRDIKDLQLVKIQSANGKYRYAINQAKEMPVSDRFVKIFRETITSFTAAENLIVVKTLSGCASAAGEAIDTCGLPHIVGSIAGDNTLLLIADSNQSVPEIIQAFQNMLQLRDKK